MEKSSSYDTVQNKKVEYKDSVLIHFGRFNGLDDIHELDMQLWDGIDGEVGTYDGHEVAVDDSHGTLYSYGKNAELLYKTMMPILDRFTFLDEARVEMNFYNPDGSCSSLEITRQTNHE